MGRESGSSKEGSEQDNLPGIEDALRELSKKGANDTIDMYQHMRGISALNACLSAIEEELAANRISEAEKARLEGFAFEMTLTGFAKKNTQPCFGQDWDVIISRLDETFQPHFRLLGRLAGLLKETPSDSIEDNFDPQRWTPF